MQQCHGCYLREISQEETQGVAGARIALVPKDVAARMRDAPPKPPPGRRS